MEAADEALVSEQVVDDDGVQVLRECDPSSLEKFSFAGQSFYTRIIDMYDGDSFRIVVHVNGLMFYVMTRLLGIDTPEIASKNAVEKGRAVAARDYALSWALQTPVAFGSKKEIKVALKATPAIVFVKCQEFDRYGRILVHVYRTRDDAGPSLNEQLITAGHAVAYAGDTKVHDWSAPDVTV
jgi:endonuclease YncB( thermonuclease family)